jgi:hypothetical protein
MVKGMTYYSEGWRDGYEDGKKFHLDGNYDAKDHGRYQEDEDYRRGFDDAGDDS